MVKPEDILEICAFIEAADESKHQNGAPATLDNIWGHARKEAHKKMKLT